MIMVKFVKKKLDFMTMKFVDFELSLNSFQVIC